MRLRKRLKYIDIILNRRHGGLGIYTGLLYHLPVKLADADLRSLLFIGLSIKRNIERHHRDLLRCSQFFR